MRYAVVTAVARARYRAQLEAFGLPGDAVSLGVEIARAVHVPYHLGLFSGPAGSRIVAVDATTGTLDPGMGEVLTGAIGALRQTLGS